MWREVQCNLVQKMELRLKLYSTLKKTLFFSFDSFVVDLRLPFFESGTQKKEFIIT